MRMDTDELEVFMIVLAIIYNFFYGALCWALLGWLGLLFGLNFLLGGAVVGLILRRKFRK